MLLFDRDHWREILHVLGSNKLRTSLTAFGVFWGVFMLMVMLGSGSGLENGVTSDFNHEATNSFFVWTRQTTKPYRGLPAGRRFDLIDADGIAIRERVPQVDVVTPRHQLGGYRGGNNVTRRGKAGAFSVMGDYPEIRQVRWVHVTEGRFLNKLDLERRRKIAVIGTRVRELLFEPDEDPIGDSIRINGVYFKVVGLFRPAESGEDGLEEAATIYLPFTTFQKAFNRGNTVGWFAMTSDDGVPASEAQQRVLALMRERHRVAPDDERALGTWNNEEEYNEIQGLFLGISTLIWIVGSGTLAAGVVGVSNIMLVIVRERTREIGIRRALGATPLAVSGQIVLEAVLLTSIAGYLGLAGGIGLVEALRGSGLEAEMFMNPNVSLPSALKALGIVIVSGALAGLIPARWAVKIPPVDALRAV